MDNIEELNRTGKASIGTPDDAVAMLERFWQKTGGFGCMLILAHDWANFEATKKSYEMFMRYVLPKFAGLNETRKAHSPGSAAIARNSQRRQSGGDEGGQRLPGQTGCKAKPEAAE